MQSLSANIVTHSTFGVSNLWFSTSRLLWGYWNQSQVLHLLSNLLTVADVEARQFGKEKVWWVLQITVVDLVFACRFRFPLLVLKYRTIYTKKSLALRTILFLLPRRDIICVIWKMSLWDERVELYLQVTIWKGRCGTCKLGMQTAKVPVF